MHKYKSLPVPPSRKKEGSLSLGFNEIESILRLTLPEIAYRDATWWSNDAGHAHATSWLESGWMTRDVDLDARQVAFVLRPDALSLPRRDIFGCMAGTITIAPGVDLTAPSDEVWNAEEGRHLNE
jgi:hypothetical protein